VQFMSRLFRFRSWTGHLLKNSYCEWTCGVFSANQSSCQNGCSFLRFGTSTLVRYLIPRPVCSTAATRSKTFTSIDRYSYILLGNMNEPSRNTNEPSQEWKKTFNSTLNRLSNQYLTLLRAASSEMALDDAQIDQRGKRLSLLLLAAAGC